MKFQSCVMRTDVTCVVYLEDYVIAGMGGSIHIFEVPSTRLKKKLDVFYGQKVHGICPGPNKLVAVFGGRSLKIFSSELSDQIQFVLLSAMWVDDWILCLNWLEGGTDLALVTANNVVSQWNWKTRKIVFVAHCVEKCILYSALLVGRVWDQLTVMGGTVFREVVVWAPVPQEMGDSPVQHRLKGHQGVIFSISYNPSTGHIYTTSDDRTVGVWKVEPETPVSWADAQIILERKVFGHLARVWRCVGLDDIFISIGEDSQLCLWDKSGSLLRRWSTHQGGSVWSMDCSREAHLLVTGGGDGGINLWPLRKWRNMSLRPVPLTFPDKEYIPRRVSVLATGNIVVITDRGCLLHCMKGTWSPVLCDARLVNYCLLEVSRCRQLVALATLKGHILILQENIACKPALSIIVDTAAVEGKIFSLHWLSTELLLTCGDLGKMVLWVLKQQGDSYWLERTYQFLLPPCKEHWITSAVLVDSCLLCGDRSGSIHLYSLAVPDCTSEKAQVPNDTVLKLHGRLGVNALECYGEWIYSTGKDSALRQHRLDKETLKLELMCSHRLPMEWATYISDSPLGLLVAGFIETNFVLWSKKEQRILVEILCGGGHRSWDCAIGTQGFTFAHIKDKQVHLMTCKFESLVQPVLQEGFHIRTVNCMRLLRPSGSSTPLLVSGGEDTTVRVISVPQDSDLQMLSVQRSHIGSVRALALCTLSDSSVLLFSAGGRAQMKVWLLHVGGLYSQEVICHEVDTHMLNPSNYGERKPWRLLEPQVESQTRYMSLYAVRSSSGIVNVIAGCSDGVLRLFSYDVDDQKLQLLDSFEFHNCCILLVSFIAEPQLVLTMSTDGNIAFWDWNSVCRKRTAQLRPLFVCQLHKSGINSHDLVHIERDLVLMATGGDDNAIVLTLFRVTSQVEVLLQWRKDSAHATQVTGLAFVGDFLISTSIDQRVLVWMWHCDCNSRELQASVTSEFCSTIADIQGLQAWSSRCNLNICVYGRGMEVISGTMFDSEIQDAANKEVN